VRKLKTTDGPTTVPVVLGHCPVVKKTHLTIG